MKPAPPVTSSFTSLLSDAAALLEVRGQSVPPVGQQHDACSMPLSSTDQAGRGALAANISVVAERR